jgi:hypothetical protein
MVVYLMQLLVLSNEVFMPVEFIINGYEFSLKQNKDGKWSLSQWSVPTMPNNEKLKLYIEALTLISDEITKRNINIQ